MRAQQETKEAQSTAADFEAQLNFLSNGMLKLANPDDPLRPNKAFEGSIKLVDVLDRAAEKVERFSEHPLIEASVRLTLGRAYYGLGEYAKASKQLELAEMLRRRHLGGKDPARLEVQHELAHVQQALGDYEQAERSIRDVITLRNDTLGAEHPDTLRARYVLASIWLGLDKLVQAEREFTAVWRLQRQVLPSLHRDTLLSQAAVADTRARMGKLDDAQKLYIDTVSAMGPILGADHPVTLATTNNLAMLHLLKAQEAKSNGSSDLTERELKAAQVLLEQVVADGAKRLGENHSEQLRHVANLARVYDELGEYKKAIDLTKSVLEKSEAALGKAHSSTLAVRQSLGGLYLHDQQYTLAEPILLETWKSVETLPEYSAELKQTLVSNLITLYERMGKPAKATEWEAVRTRLKAGKP